MEVNRKRKAESGKLMAESISLPPDRACLAWRIGPIVSAWP